MKKLIILVVFTIFLSGCGNFEIESNIGVLNDVNTVFNTYSSKWEYPFIRTAVGEKDGYKKNYQLFNSFQVTVNNYNEYKNILSLEVKTAKKEKNSEIEYLNIIVPKRSITEASYNYLSGFIKDILNALLTDIKEEELEKILNELQFPNYKKFEKDINEEDGTTKIINVNKKSTIQLQNLRKEYKLIYEIGEL